MRLKRHLPVGSKARIELCPVFVFMLSSVLLSVPVSLLLLQLRQG